MVKAKMTNGIALLGLSAYNVELLKKGKPIRLNLKELGLPDQEIIIMYGETETKIVDAIQEALGGNNPFKSKDTQN